MTGPAPCFHAFLAVKYGPVVWYTLIAGTFNIRGIRVFFMHKGEGIACGSLKLHAP